MFRSFFMGGFECSTHRIKSGRRLDLVASTRHDEFCQLDYERLIRQGIKVAREGLRWHLIEQAPNVYDFSTARPILEAAKAHGVQVIWDLCHYGWPDFLEIFHPAFLQHFRHFAAAFASFLKEHAPEEALITPMNEISFFSWAGGDAGYFPPHCRGRGLELKVHLVRAALGAMEAIREILPHAKFFQIDPIIHVVAHPNRRRDRKPAEQHRVAQFQAWNMLGGYEWPALGGAPDNLEIVGLNYYSTNQWIHRIETIRPGHPLYRPLRQILAEVYERYGRPIVITETGTEDDARPGWFRYVCEEVHAARQAGLPIHGICLYPILNHPGWDDDRHCHNGLWDYPDDAGHREIYVPLAEELQRWRPIFETGSPVVPKTEPEKEMAL